MPRPHRFRKVYAPFLCHGEQRRGIFFVESKGLFAQDGHARRQAAAHILRVVRGVDAHVRPLYAGGGERLFGRGERPRAELFRKRLRALCRAVPNRGNAATALLLDLYGDLAGDVARADERPAELCQLRFLLFNFLFIFLLNFLFIFFCAFFALCSHLSTVYV